MQNHFGIQNLWMVKNLSLKFKRIPLAMRLLVLFFACAMNFAHASDTYAQTSRITIEVTNQTVEYVLEQIKAKTGLDYFCNNAHVNLNRKVSVSLNNGSVDEVLNQVIEGTNVTYSIVDNKIIFSVKESVAKQSSDLLVKGKVVDSKGEPVIGAAILEKGTTNGTVTDYDGNFTLTLNSEKAELQISSCGFRPNKAEWDSSLVADVIDVKEKHVLKKHQVSPIWVSVQVPQNVSKGKYTGEVIVYSNAHECQRLKLQVEVMNRELPKPSEWGFHLDLWQNPYAVARFHNVKVWSKEHFDLMRPVMQALADAGQKVVTTSIMHKPWNGQTYDYFESMIVWRKTLSGEWKFTFDVFDKWVEFMVSLGIDKQINCYSMVPWSYSFQYFDECTNKMQVVKCKPGEPAYNEMWTAFLTAFAKHLKEKNWFDKTCIAMDERPMPVMKTVISLVKGVDKNFKLALAGLYYEEIEKDLYDYCISTDQSYPKEVIERRAKDKLVTTYYTYCADCKPNCFTFSDPAESSWMPLYSAKLGIGGYLRWAYNSWVINPLQDSRFRQWPAGDTYLVYPGYRSSVRFEKMIEGIQLYEKIRILKESYENNPSVLKRIDKTLQTMNIESLKQEGRAASDVKKIMDLTNNY